MIRPTDWRRWLPGHFYEIEELVTLVRATLSDIESILDADPGAQGAHMARLDARIRGLLSEASNIADLVYEEAGLDDPGQRFVFPVKPDMKELRDALRAAKEFEKFDRYALERVFDRTDMAHAELRRVAFEVKPDDLSLVASVRGSLAPSDPLEWPPGTFEQVDRALSGRLDGVLELEVDRYDDLHLKMRLKIYPMDSRGSHIVHAALYEIFDLARPGGQLSLATWIPVPSHGLKSAALAWLEENDPDAYTWSDLAGEWPYEPVGALVVWHHYAPPASFTQDASSLMTTLAWVERDRLRPLSEKRQRDMIASAKEAMVQNRFTHGRAGAFPTELVNGSLAIFIVEDLSAVSLMNPSWSGEFPVDALAIHTTPARTWILFVQSLAPSLRDQSFPIVSAHPPRLVLYESAVPFYSLVHRDGARTFADAVRSGTQSFSTPLVSTDRNEDLLAYFRSVREAKN